MVSALATGTSVDAAFEGSTAEWWRQAVVYQIYPRSFADSDGDGAGDLRGVTSRVGYLASLGVDAVWLSPFYPSGLADGGYDVSDYRAVDPRLGSLADFGEMVAALHGVGIKVIVDIVPNHTSDQHQWFQDALVSEPGSPARNRYVFRDGVGPGGARPPAPWTSVFGGPAWTRVPDGQWYLHQFAPEQPDLNWDNPEVRQDFLTTLRFWGDREVDGFRVDVAHGLAKNLSDPLPDSIDMRADGLPLDGSHPLLDRDEVHDIYAEWRHVFNEYDPPLMAVAEAWVPAARRARYASSDGLGQVFNFDLLTAKFDAQEFRNAIDEQLGQAQEAGTSTVWVLSNHDVVRHPTRYGLPPGIRDQVAQQWLLSAGEDPPLDRDLGLRRARAATLLMLALPGATYLYQGEELGLHEVGDLPSSVLQDPVFQRTDGRQKGRDGCRVPLPWTADGPSFGFGPAGAHLPQPRWFRDVAVDRQDRDPGSTLSLYRSALAWRRRLQSDETLAWVVDAGPSVVHVRRHGGWHCVTNFGTTPVALPQGEVLVTSADLAAGLLPSGSTAWVLDPERRR